MTESTDEATLPPADLIVDALLGYSLSSDPREPVATLIRWANASRCPVLSLDTPSGLDVGPVFATGAIVAIG